MKQDMIQSMIDLFETQTIGFNNMMPKVLTSVSEHFPKTNLIKVSEGEYKVELAVAGFNKDNLTISQNGNLLTVEGEKTETEENYIYKGIANRSFKKQLPVATGVEVLSASVENGILTINLKNNSSTLKQITIQ